MRPLLDSTRTNAADFNRALLAERLRQAAAQPLRRPLSFAQQRLWFLDQLEPNSPLYNIVTAVRMTGTLRVSALERSLSAILERHQPLRTRFPCDDAGPEQVIDPPVEIHLEPADLAPKGETEREEALRQVIREETNRPFDLGRDSLFRAKLVRLRADEHVLVLVMHHIVSDEWSLKVLFGELGKFYEGFVQSRSVTLPPLPIQYADFAEWQRQWLTDEVLEAQVSYWKKQLESSHVGEWEGYGRAARGHIGLQDYNDTLWFRNIKIRELPRTTS